MEIHKWSELNLKEWLKWFLIKCIINIQLNWELKRTEFDLIAVDNETAVKYHKDNYINQPIGWYTLLDFNGLNTVLGILKDFWYSSKKINIYSNMESVICSLFNNMCNKLDIED